MPLKSFGSAFFAKVGVEGSNPFARSKSSSTTGYLREDDPSRARAFYIAQALLAA
jgi:hypothetical protein